MLDKTISETALGDGRVRYTLGAGNWNERRIPDIRNPGGTVVIPENRLLDVIILGDGYTTAACFRDALEEWLDDFYALRVYELFAGALRVRALYTPSTEAASSQRDSFYRTKIDPVEGWITNDDWWLANDADGIAFRTNLWAGVDTFADHNTRRYPLDLTVGTGQAITDDRLRDLYRNLTVSLLVKTEDTGHPSGFTRDIARPAPDQSRRVRVGFGANEIHEFSHAFGLLSDEYINGRGKGNDENRVNPERKSVFSLSNLSYSDREDEVPWLHLSPGGDEPRSAGGDDPSPVVGWLWIGGTIEIGAWHSEYRCLMNGRHDNYAFTQVASEDPTANADGTYTGASLRDGDRLCLWCQEITTLRILERTDQLLEAGDPSGATEQGELWYTRWVDELRDRYWELFDLPSQIAQAEARYAELTPGRNGEPLWQSDLCSVPKASPRTANRQPLPTDEELLVLFNA